MYRGEHHPTDILASVLFAALWLTAATLLINPGQDGRGQAGRWRLSLPHRKTADAIRETTPAAG
jgi:membrane-associated phospholipid phosphatase